VGYNTRRARDVDKQKLEVSYKPEYAEDVEQYYWNPKLCVYKDDVFFLEQRVV
jgi:hypothetical protein